MKSSGPEAYTHAKIYLWCILLFLVILSVLKKQLSNETQSLSTPSVWNDSVEKAPPLRLREWKLLQPWKSVGECVAPASGWTMSKVLRGQAHPSSSKWKDVRDVLPLPPTPPLHICSCESWWVTTFHFPLMLKWLLIECCPQNNINTRDGWQLLEGRPGKLKGRASEDRKILWEVTSWSGKAWSVKDAKNWFPNGL